LTAKAVNPRESTYDKIDLLLKGKIFDCEGNRYTPSFTTKKGVRYSYYISLLLNQRRDHPSNIIARIPSETFEKTVLKAANELLSGDQLLSVLGIGEDNLKLAKWVKANAHQLELNEVLACLNKAVVHEQEVVLHFNWPNLVNYIDRQLKIELLQPGQVEYLHNIPFTTRRADKGALIMCSKDESVENDPFDKSPLELKNWVRGIVWRDEFFDGTMITDIAKREKLDARYVGRLIEASLTV
jgi:hypothetical protein